jgi:opacity protein-like surface antigen
MIRKLNRSFISRLVILPILLLLGISTPFAVVGNEVVPFIGYRFGGNLDGENSGNDIDLKEAGNGGLILSWPAGHKKHYELLYSYQQSGLVTDAGEEVFDLDIHYLHLGGRVDYSGEDMVPFLSGGIGLTHMNPQESAFHSETRFSISIGGGFKWRISETTGMRLEFRGYETFLRSSGSLFCGDGACELSFSGEGTLQFETNLGISIGF